MPKTQTTNKQLHGFKYSYLALIILCYNNHLFAQLGLVWFGLIWFYGISTFVGYLILNPFLYV